MSAEIAARKRGCSERGVKLTVVLMASRRMLGQSFFSFLLPVSADLVKCVVAETRFRVDTFNPR